MGTTLNVEVWDTTAANNDDADSGIVWTEGQMPSTVNNSGRGMMAAVAKWKLDISGGIVAGGTGDAITLTTNRSISIGHIVNGFAVRFRASATNTGATTVAIDGLTAKDVKTQGGAALSAGAIVSGGVYDIAYSETATAFVLLNGTQDTSSFLTASSTATLTNKTFNANGTGNSISNVEVADFAGSAIVTEAEGLASSDNDTSLPTTAAVKDYVDIAAEAAIGVLSIQVFTSSMTYTPTSGMKYCWCRVQAGGGAGGGADTNASAKASGGGGGGGECREGILTAADIGASKSVTVGAGGTGGSSSGGDGSSGGSSSIGTLIVANGGAGGTGTGSNTSSETPRPGGAGGSGGSGGSLSIPGEDGGLGIVFGAKGGDIGLGNGGGSQLGRAPKTAVLMDSAGPASTGYGAGSCGATEDDGTGTAAADARPGVVIIMEFA